MEWLLYLVASLFGILGFACLISLVLGLPGTWMTLALALLIEWADRFYLPEGARQTFPVWLLIASFLMACLAEVLEFLAGALGAKRMGSSRAGMVGALLGGLAGAIFGLWIPVPIVGSLIGALIGSFAGAVLGELSADPDKTWRDSMRPASGAAIGKILGTLAKVPIAVVVWLSLTVAAFWP